MSIWKGFVVGLLYQDAGKELVLLKRGWFRSSRAFRMDKGDGRRLIESLGFAARQKVATFWATSRSYGPGAPVALKARKLLCGVGIPATAAGLSAVSGVSTEVLIAILAGLATGGGIATNQEGYRSS
jgi:hypothetical protein